MKITKKLVFILVILSTFYLLLSTTIHAQQSLDVLPMTVFPAVQDRLVKPGERARFQIQFRNGGDSPVAGLIRVANYLIVDKQGTPQLIEDANTEPKFGAASWITAAVDRITIPPKDFVTVDLAAQVPYDVTTCGKYAMVYFEPSLTNLTNPTAPVQPNSASIIRARLGGLVNFQVQSKECKEMAELQNIIASKFLEYGPIDLKFDVYNGGDLHIAPRGLAVLTNLFGQGVDQQVLQDQNVFPESAKTMDLKFGSHLMFGRFKINLEASYGTQGKKLMSTVYVWVFPWKVTVIVLLALIILILLVRNFYGKTIKKEASLESEIKEEKEEIEKLKEELRRRKE